MNCRRVFTTMLTVALFINTLPDYISIYKADRMLDADTEMLLNTVIIPPDGLIYTNISSWGLFDYYYPQSKVIYGDGYLETLWEQQNEVWVFWTEEVELNREIEGLGYCAAKVYEGNFPNGVYCFVYEISKND